MNGGKSLSVPLVSSVGLPSRETAKGFCSARKSLTCSSCASKWTALDKDGVFGSLLLEVIPVKTERLPLGGVFVDLSDDFTSCPDLFLTIMGGVALTGADLLEAPASGKWDSEACRFESSRFKRLSPKVLTGAREMDVSRSDDAGCSVSEMPPDSDDERLRLSFDAR